MKLLAVGTGDRYSSRAVVAGGGSKRIQVAVPGTEPYAGANCWRFAKSARPAAVSVQPAELRAASFFFCSVSSAFDTDVGFARAAAATWAGFNGPF